MLIINTVINNIIFPVAQLSGKRIKEFPLADLAFFSFYKYYKMRFAFEISLTPLFVHQKKKKNMKYQLSLAFHVLVYLGLIHVTAFVVSGEPQVPCFFIFGDSLVDSGNNNALTTAAKANYRPYGIDFPQGVTGRFTNGRTVADIIGQLLGFPKFIPPYATATDQEISTGVNYGSGSAGIREESGSHLGDRISMDRQLLNHEKIISRLSALQSNKTFTDAYLKKCIYLSNIGSNDYINNYLIPSIYSTSKTYTADEYAAVLVQQYSQQLKTIYNLGARKIAVFGLGQVGCTPAEIRRFGTNGKPCVEWINDEVQLFNDKLKSLVAKLNTDYQDARFTLINLTSISAPQGDVPLPNTPCCQVGEDGQCVPDSKPCLVRALTVFYDGFHPSEISNTAIATRSYISVIPTDTYPYDISHLARL
ncbi:putative triacylglycerol lipase [Helianthus debilis subsp. tardiflorus]